MEFVLPLVILSWRRWRLQDWERILVIFALEAISAFYFYTRISNGFLFWEMLNIFHSSSSFP
jgi:hypothetical protein